MHNKCFSAWPEGKLRLFWSAQGRGWLIGGLPLCCLLAFSLPAPHLRPLQRRAWSAGGATGATGGFFQEKWGKMGKMGKNGEK